MKAVSISQFRDLCHQHGWAVTHQRQIIFETLMAMPGIPVLKKSSSGSGRRFRQSRWRRSTRQSTHFSIRESLVKSVFTTGHFELIATYAHIIIWCAPGVSRSPTSMTRIWNQFSCANLCQAVSACRDMQLKFWGCAQSAALGPKLILKSNVINMRRRKEC